MTSDQIQAFIRNVLMIAGGYFVSKGTLTADTLTTVVAGVGAVVGLVWSWLHIGGLAAAAAPAVVATK